jgi:hypothetical protein
VDGIPHIIANNEHDMIMLQGWVHAQDRLFQMDLTRRQGRSRQTRGRRPHGPVSSLPASLHDSGSPRHLVAIAHHLGPS